MLNRPHPLDVDMEIMRFSNQAANCGDSWIDAAWVGNWKTVTGAHDDMVARGVPSNIAGRVSESLYAFSLLDIIEAAHVHDEDAGRLANIYFELSDRLGVDRLLLAVSSLPREVAAGMRWPGALREDLYRSLRDLTIDVTKFGTDDEAGCSVATTSRLITGRGWTGPSAHWVIPDTDGPDLAALSVATTAASTASMS